MAEFKLKFKFWSSFQSLAKCYTHSGAIQFYRIHQFRSMLFGRRVYSFAKHGRLVLRWQMSSSSKLPVSVCHRAASTGVLSSGDTVQNRLSSHYK
ncbi:hypothetical protein L9F63_010762, partial [Diploptera punctata]